MPEQYKYRAVSDDGRIHAGAISATGAVSVEEFLSAHGLHPIRIEPLKKKSAVSCFGFFSPARYENLIMFTSAFATLYRAGVPLLRALAIIRIGRPGSRFNQAIDGMSASIESGKPLSEAMSEHEDIFPKVYAAGVAAGEESGKLDKTLDNLASALEKEMELTRQVRIATRYPLIVMLVITAALVILMTFVIPRFVDFYGSFGVQLPVSTRILITVSDLITHWWPVILAATAVTGLGFYKLLTTKTGRLWFDRQVGRFPVIGDIVVKGNVARFALMFRILFGSGIPVVKSLDIVAPIVKNTAVSMEIRKLSELFRRGGNIDVNTEEFRLLPDLALNMMAVGMESGSIDRVMKELGNHFSQEVLYRSRQLTSVLEPILTLVLGAFVLIIALAVFLPMWSLIQVFHGG
jgi:type II secretory pathway component PulF